MTLEGSFERKTAAVRSGDPRALEEIQNFAEDVRGGTDWAFVSVGLLPCVDSSAGENWIIGFLHRLR